MAFRMGIVGVLGITWRQKDPLIGVPERLGSGIGVMMGRHDTHDSTN